MPLAVVVLAVHLALLQSMPRRLAPQGTRAVPFATRSVLAPPAVARAPEPAPTPARLPAPGTERPATAAEPTARQAAAVLPPPGPAREAAPALAEPARAAPALEPPAPAAPTPAPAAPAPPAPLPPPAPAAARPAAPAHALPLPPIALPPPVRLHYEVAVQKGLFSLSGDAVLDWRQDGQQYEARLEARGLVGSRVQRSTGRITPEGLAPAYFSDKSRGEQATHFDRANGRLVFSNNRPEAALEGGMQDRLSVLLQLAALVAGDPAKYPPGTQVAIPTASTREADTWVFAVEGEEDLALPGGPVRALKLQRLPRREYDQKVELWLAPRMDYAPVRLRLTNPNGDTVDNRWSSTDRG